MTQGLSYVCFITAASLTGLPFSSLSNCCRAYDSAPGSVCAFSPAISPLGTDNVHRLAADFADKLRLPQAVLLLYYHH
ncbi:hypothetical protein MHZ97_21755 [Pantoea sp. ACRSC]|nr:hypothetical protein [Pantoea sp. ACRSC]MCG7399092.1 hypothetical protein [Pantoea sp. ACRSC]